MKREVPLFITAAAGLLIILSFFVPHQIVSVPADFLQQTALILRAFGFVLGGVNVLLVNFDAIYKRQPGWIYKVVLVVTLIATVVIGAVEGRGFDPPQYCYISISLQPGRRSPRTHRTGSSGEQWRGPRRHRSGKRQDSEGQWP